jgi:hypothetical protein
MARRRIGGLRPLVSIALGCAAAPGLAAENSTAPSATPGTTTGGEHTPWSGAAPPAPAVGRASASRPGGRTASQTDRQVYITGVVDVDYLSQSNYTDGNNDIADHQDFGLIRGELGARIELDERVEVDLTVAYDADAGDDTWKTGASSDANQGDVVMDDAFAIIKELFNRPEISLAAGRQPFVWNMRREYPGFLYDSRADDPDVTSWDGVKGMWTVETLGFTPYLFAMPDDSRLFGISVDWEPAEVTSGNLFVTGSANVERDVVLAGGTTGKTLFTYYGGVEMKFDNGLDLYGEGGLQRGEETGDIDFAGYGFSAGIDYHLPTVNRAALGIQADYLSGDDDPSDSKNHAFINNWEGTSDTYIVEHEKYGELSEFLNGDLEAAKFKAETALDRNDRFHLKLTYGFYRTTEETADGNRDFGQEFDLTFSWQYTWHSKFSFLSGAFLPGDAFVDTAPGTSPSDDMVTLFAANLQVAF